MKINNELKIILFLMKCYFLIYIVCELIEDEICIIVTPENKL
jgi:hypothetical protein